MNKLFTFLILFFSPLLMNSQHTFTAGNLTYIEDFTIFQFFSSGSWTNNAPYMPGWYSTETSYNFSTGHQNTGSLYNYGAGAHQDNGQDRSLGSLASAATGDISYGLRFVNNTGSTIASLNITYAGEQWRRSANTNKLYFSYQLNASNLTSGSWTSDSNFDFEAPQKGTSANLDGNGAANRKAISNTLNVNVAQGEEIWIRWTDINESGDNQGMSIDDIFITAVLEEAPLPVDLLCFKIEEYQQKSSVKLCWRTSSEIDHDFFEIQRSVDGKSFQAIGRIEGNGNTQEEKKYVFYDESPLIGKNYYRLKQVDFSGAYEHSKIIQTQNNENQDSSFEIFPNPTNGLINLKFNTSTETKAKVEIYNSNGKSVFSKALSNLMNGAVIELPKNLPKGMYYIHMFLKGKLLMKRVLKN